MIVNIIRGTVVMTHCDCLDSVAAYDVRALICTKISDSLIHVFNTLESETVSRVRLTGTEGIIHRSLTGHAGGYSP